MARPPLVSFNPSVQLVLADVDSTVADVYKAATPRMVRLLQKVLERGVSIFFVTGQSAHSVQWRITDRLPASLRQRVLIGACSGAEVWGFDSRGRLLSKPFYSLYEKIPPAKKREWRAAVKQLISEFGLRVHPTEPVLAFQKRSKHDPLSVMLEDRGPQITLEVVNGPQVRLDLFARSKILFKNAKLPFTPRLAGTFALDFAVKGVSKTTAVRFVLNRPRILRHAGVRLTPKERADPSFFEVWVDKFSVHGGTDLHLLEALDARVRAITFRDEKPSELPKRRVVVRWNGKERLEKGLEEFLASAGF
jgi:hydroxymethylpyrimidine pyrophosphatase-like HAD family hydrolase